MASRSDDSTRRRAASTVAHNARDTDDHVNLLAMLGLDAANSPAEPIRASSASVRPADRPITSRTSGSQVDAIRQRLLVSAHPAQPGYLSVVAGAGSLPYTPRRPLDDVLGFLPGMAPRRRHGAPGPSTGGVASRTEATSVVEAR